MTGARKSSRKSSLPPATTFPHPHAPTVQPPIEVDSDVAVCDGGGGALGHPIEYIKLVGDKTSVCKYCGLRYVQKGRTPKLDGYDKVYPSNPSGHS